MERTKIFTALRGVRGRKTVDLDALKAIVVRFSELVVDQPRLREIDINPLVASPQQLLALDARMVLFNRDIADAELPRSAIRRYPTEYVSNWTMKDGSVVVLRPIRPEDETLMVEFHKSLSDSTVYLRYFQMQRLESRVAHERLIRRCFLDYGREIALVVERPDRETGRRELIGVGRLARQRQIEDAELGVVVADRFQRAGLGTELMRRLLQIARTRKSVASRPTYSRKTHPCLRWPNTFILIVFQMKIWFPLPRRSISMGQVKKPDVRHTTR
jgi:acetyltransferase